MGSLRSPNEKGSKLSSSSKRAARRSVQVSIERLSNELKTSNKKWRA